MIWRALAPHLAAIPRDSAEWLVAQTGNASLCVALGDRTTAAELYGLLLPFQALHAVASAETPSDRPVALYLGRLANLLGDRRAAREHLNAAIRMSDVMHAPPAAAEARADLDALGVASELSRREDEVVALVARGHSNREIATQLYLSERTVESHVSSALRKLNLSSRAALAAWSGTHRGSETSSTRRLAAPTAVRSSASSRPGLRSGFVLGNGPGRRQHTSPRGRDQGSVE